MADWQVIARRKREEILEAIPAKWRLPCPFPKSKPDDVTGDFVRSFLDKREIEITEMDASKILNRTRSGEWTAKEVAKAFCHRAAVAHQLVNCLHEVFFEEAIRDADVLDKYFSEHGEPVGPLHGLPISLKDSINVNGVGTTLGFVGWIDTFEGKKRNSVSKLEAEAQIATTLRDLGAILHVKTSVPQASLAGETFNNIIEYTYNPLNTRLSAGGSSGGEAALLALKGSPLGLGTDIGGSIRFPAGSCGLYGLKPTTGRLPYRGIATVVGGKESVTDIKFAVGPMASDVRSLGLLTRAVLAEEPWTRDPCCHDIPWRETAFHDIRRRAQTAGSERLVFGLMNWDRVVHPQPPIARALDAIKKAVENAGHEVVNFDPPSHAKAVSLWNKACFTDGCSSVHAQFALSGEPVDARMPAPFRVRSSDAKIASATEIMAINTAIREYKEAYLRSWMETARLSTTGKPMDVVIMPIAPSTATRIGRLRWFGYTTVLNVLDYPAAVIPVIKADRLADVYDSKGNQKLNDINKLVREDYDPDLYHGMPVGVQIVGRRFQEEQVLAVSEYLDTLLRQGYGGDTSRL